jgi:transcriptional regulator with XRE-family HTH domain
MEFCDRLKKYREELGIIKKRDMAAELGISESFYNLLESGNRPPSKNILRKLFLLSKMPEEYWRYGVSNEQDYLEKREDFKCLKDAIDQLSEIGLIGLDKEFSEGAKEVILAAAIADITHILEKRNAKPKEE